MALVWSVALVAAVAWPGRLVGPLDGAPFDTTAKALAFGIVLPALWWLYPAVMRTTVARTLLVLLLAWKIGGWMFIPQSGWCGQFLVANPPTVGGWSLTRSWDLRTYWHKTPTACSAIVARGYSRPTQFPAWSINLPYGHDRDLSSGGLVSLPEETLRPPRGEYALELHGAMYAPAAGTLRLLTGSDVSMTGALDATPIVPARGQDATIEVGPGSHDVNLRLELKDRDWRFVPQWNGVELFSAVATGTQPLTRLGALAQRFGRWVTPVIILGLLGWWIGTALAALKPGVVMLTATAALTAAIAFIAFSGAETTAARTSVVLLGGCLLVPVPERMRNARGAWLLVGAPWLAVIASLAIRNVGRFTLFLFGDDTLTYQRFAHRIFMEGFWLEGGQPTFWNQPLYRWILGVLHLLFGDSSAGETIWDGFALLVGAMFAYAIVSRAAGFRIGIVAAVAVLLTVSLGPNWYIVGRGLSEISALMWLYLAACCLLDADDTSTGRAVLAGVFGVLAFYTRMNHLPLVIALAAITLVRGVEAGSVFNLPRLWQRLPKRAVAIYGLTLMVGLLAFAARTWYYTGRFSIFAGTQLGYLRVGVGHSADSFWPMEAVRQAASSILMIATVQDPPRFDWRSVLVIGGFGWSVLSLLGVPVARRLPFGLASFCEASVAGGLVARGTAYPGRFSVHLIPAAVAASMLALVSLQEVVGWRLTS